MALLDIGSRLAAIGSGLSQKGTCQIAYWRDRRATVCSSYASCRAPRDLSTSRRCCRGTSIARRSKREALCRGDGYYVPLTFDAPVSYCTVQYEAKDKLRGNIRSALSIPNQTLKSPDMDDRGNHAYAIIRMRMMIWSFPRSVDILRRERMAG